MASLIALATSGLRYEETTKKGGRRGRRGVFVASAHDGVQSQAIVEHGKCASAAVGGRLFRWKCGAHPVLCVASDGGSRNVRSGLMLVMSRVW